MAVDPVLKVVVIMAAASWKRLRAHEAQGVRARCARSAHVMLAAHQQAFGNNLSGVVAQQQATSDGGQWAWKSISENQALRQATSRSAWPVSGRGVIIIVSSLQRRRRNGKLAPRPDEPRAGASAYAVA